MKRSSPSKRSPGNQSSPSNQWLELSDPEAVRIVTDPKARRFLEPLIGQERSAGQLARELGVDLSSVLYRVEQFMRLGLVEVGRLEPRRGRAVRYYRAVADGFYIPFGATAHPTTETLSPDAFENLQTLLNKSIAHTWTEAAGEPLALGLHLYRHADGGLYRNITPHPDEDAPNRFFETLLEPSSAAVWDTWGVRRLSRADAKKLQQELASVFKRYQPSDAEEDREYIIRLALAPLAE